MAGPDTWSVRFRTHATALERAGRHLPRSTGIPWTGPRERREGVASRRRNTGREEQMCTLHDIMAESWGRESRQEIT